MTRRRFGHVDDVEVGTMFKDRREAYDAHIHRTLQSGISGGSDGADSICLSGGYPDDRDLCDTIMYTGQGGYDRPKRQQVADQKLHLGNLGLVRSHQEGFPVRVLRGSKTDSPCAPTRGYRYDGLYQITSRWLAERDGYAIFQFKLETLEPGALQAALALAMPSRSRAEVRIQRLLRNAQHAKDVKAWHQHICQVCGEAVQTPAGPYAEGAHIRPLGKPHDGPDTTGNLLCLCPNDHIRFDTGAIYIDDRFQVRDSKTDCILGPLRHHPRHRIDRAFVDYHRAHVSVPQRVRDLQGPQHNHPEL